MGADALIARAACLPRTWPQYCRNMNGQAQPTSSSLAEHCFSSLHVWMTLNVPLAASVAAPVTRVPTGAVSLSSGADCKHARSVFAAQNRVCDIQVQSLCSRNALKFDDLPAVRHASTGRFSVQNCSRDVLSQRGDRVRATDSPRHGILTCTGGRRTCVAFSKSCCLQCWQQDVLQQLRCDLPFNAASPRLPALPKHRLRAATFDKGLRLRISTQNECKACPLVVRLRIQCMGHPSSHARAPVVAASMDNELGRDEVHIHPSTFLAHPHA
jgi:hypothetical protein